MPIRRIRRALFRALLMVLGTVLVLMLVQWGAFSWRSYYTYGPTSLVGIFLGFGTVATAFLEETLAKKKLTPARNFEVIFIATLVSYAANIFMAVNAG